MASIAAMGTNIITNLEFHKSGLHAHPCPMTLAQPCDVGATWVWSPSRKFTTWTTLPCGTCMQKPFKGNILHFHFAVLGEPPPLPFCWPQRVAPADRGEGRPLNLTNMNQFFK